MAKENKACDCLGLEKKGAGFVLYSPVSGVAGPLACSSGAGGLQLSTHAHVCVEKQVINFY